MRRALVFALLLGTAALPAGPSHAAHSVTIGDAYARFSRDGAEIGNAAIRRTYGALRNWTSDLTDLRTGAEWYGEPGPVLEIAGEGPLSLPAPVRGSVAVVDGAVELRQVHQPEPGIEVEQIARVAPGIAAMRIQLVVRSAAPLPIASYSLERLRGSDPDEQSARAINFSGGADWRSRYDYRSDTTGTDFDANAEWLEIDDGSLGLLMQRRNYLSSRMGWDGRIAAARVDLSHDKVYLGPFEEGRPESGHPPPTPARTRTVPALGALALEPVIVALGRNRDDLAWQAQRMLARDIADYPRTINFNTDRVRGAPFELGARDGVGFPQFQQLWPVAKSLGVETFVLDDGWQLYNGDWIEPDAARYPDGLEPVRDILEANGMRLGLWMAPQSFHPHSQEWKANTAATCLPVGAATAAYNAADPSSSSNAAGIGIWDLHGPYGFDGRYRDKMASDIADITERLRPSEFKFDFLVWIDCAFGSLYEQHDAFMEEIAALGHEFHGTGFGMDETNDFRGFPYESILHGPTWFQNGNPPQDAALHNVWSMAPYVPGFTIGQAVTVRPGDSQTTIDEKMAAALAYHMTFWTDIRELAGSTALIERVKLWTDFAKQHRMTNGFAYPLLSDPLGRGKWSGLQPWDADANRGMAMLYRLGAPDATQTVAFRGLTASSTYRLTDVTPTGSPFVIGAFSGAELTAGIQLTIATASGVRILTIDPA